MFDLYIFALVKENLYLEIKQILRQFVYLYRVSEMQNKSGKSSCPRPRESCCGDYTSTCGIGAQEPITEQPPLPALGLLAAALVLVMAATTLTIVLARCN